MTAQEREKLAAGERQALDELAGLIGGKVLDQLGRPGDLYRVEVRRLWEGYYRVNVLTGPDAASVKVSDSYFLQTDGGGNIVASTPRISRRYVGVTAAERSGPCSNAPTLPGPSGRT